VPALWPQVLILIPAWREIELYIRAHFAIERDWHKRIIRAIGWKSKKLARIPQIRYLKALPEAGRNQLVARDRATRN
jgi:hypothetical protein